MSDASASLVGILTPPDAGQSVSLTGKPAAAANGVDFPTVFQGVTLNPETISALTADFAMPADSMAVPVTLPASTQNVPVSMVPVADLPQQATEPASNGQDLFAVSGNVLPPAQVYWSGMTTVVDENGVASMTVAGDKQQVIHAAPAYGKDMAATLRQSQQNLYDALAFQPRPVDPDAGIPLPEVTPSVLNKQFSDQLLASLPRNTELPALSTLTTPATTTMSPLLVNDIQMQGNLPRGLDTLPVPPQHPQWGQQVGERIHWMVGQGLQQADVRLNPPELGSLEIRIQVQGEQANVQFSSPHASVREALDAAMPRLREMLEQSGLNLGNASVSSQSGGQQQATAGDSSEAGMAVEKAGEESQETVSITTDGIIPASGMVDIYA